MVECLPNRNALVGARVPIGGIFGPFQQTNLTAAAMEDTRLLYAIHTGAFSAGKNVGLAEGVGVPAVLREPVQAELSVVVEIVLGEEAVDKLERGSDTHG